MISIDVDRIAVGDALTDELLETSWPLADDVPGGGHSHCELEGIGSVQPRPEALQVWVNHWQEADEQIEGDLAIIRGNLFGKLCQELRPFFGIE